MAKSKKKQNGNSDAVALKDHVADDYFDPIELRNGASSPESAEPDYHKLGPDIVCKTDTRGFATPQNRSPNEIVLDATEGFIPLWEPNRVLRWQFNENSMKGFKSPNAAKRYIRQLMAEALNAWGDAAPIRFKEVSTGWDFEIEMSSADNCSINGCTLASAFFPDGGRHTLKLYPKVFEQSRKEQVDTMIHEIGHIFGLRHFFADVSEQAWPSEIFGEHREFSIMNYGKLSELTDQDRSDLKKLYHAVWSCQLKAINKTPIVLFRPYHDSGRRVCSDGAHAFYN